MELFWYLVTAFLLIVFFVLDGYDFGVGIIHLFYAKSESDRKVVAKAAGLFWDSNEVWLVAAGGMLFMAFPTFYASVFSGFYLPLIIVLWLIVFRAIGLEFRGLISFQMWKDFWDKSFGISSLLLALFFGIALGNIVRGVDLGSVGHIANGQTPVIVHEAHFFFLPLWTNFDALNPSPGVIDWFTILIGLIAVVTLATHGANWIVLKTEASINADLKKLVFKLNSLHLLLSILALGLWQLIRPDALTQFLDHPLYLVFPMIYFVGLFALFFTKKMKSDLTPFLFSSAVIVGGISASLAALFPVILPSTNAINPALTIYNTSAGPYALEAALPWGIFGLVLTLVYFFIQRRLTRGKVDGRDYGH